MQPQNTIFGEISGEIFKRTTYDSILKEKFQSVHLRSWRILQKAWKDPWGLAVSVINESDKSVKMFLQFKNCGEIVLLSLLSSTLIVQLFGNTFQLKFSAKF